MSIVIKTDRDVKSIENNREKRLSFLIQQAGIPLDLQCSGLGICGRCKVTLGPGNYLISGKEVVVNSSLEALSCLTYVQSDNVEVTVPQSAVLKSEGKIYDEFELGAFDLSPLTRKFIVKVPAPEPSAPLTDWQRLEIEIVAQSDIFSKGEITCCLKVQQKLPLLLKECDEITVTIGQLHGKWHIIDLTSDGSIKNYAVAIDIGTTTVATALVDMSDGAVIAKGSAYNQQMSRADDVASRISVASSGSANLGYMKDLVVNDTINPLIDNLCGQAECTVNDIFRIAISGNTVMAHLFLAICPAGIGVLPFQPVTNIYSDVTGDDIGINMHPCGVVTIVPSISGYIGGDITSDIMVTGMNNTSEVTALVDLGTNSEMILAANDQLFASAAAAGPAFEGAGIQCGCRATTGAIERIEFDSELDFKLTTIGNADPIGICGSAIIDFIANGFKSGMINSMGRLDVELLEKQNKYYLVEYESKQLHACLIVDRPEHPIYVTEADIEQILKAKGAVYAGLKTLLSEQGHTFKDLKRLILAGGFAKYIDVDNAVTIGMLPEIPRERISSIGNGSLAGAYLSLVDFEVTDKFKNIIQIPETISLNLIPDFEMNYIDALMIPNYNTEEFACL